MFLKRGRHSGTSLHMTFFHATVTIGKSKMGVCKVYGNPRRMAMQRRLFMGAVINSEHSDSIGFKLHAVMLCVCDYRIYSSKRHNVTVRHAWPLSLAPNCNPYCDIYTDVFSSHPVKIFRRPHRVVRCRMAERQ